MNKHIIRTTYFVHVASRSELPHGSSPATPDMIRAALELVKAEVRTAAKSYPDNVIREDIYVPTPGPASVHTEQFFLDDSIDPGDGQ